MVPDSKGCRADLDGLRAIAVLSVILFHADIKLFEGGFVGVDIALTLLDYLGEPPARDMHGRSLRQVLENPGLSWDHPLLQIQTAYKFGEDASSLPGAP